ncbi:MAG: hypothetical protein IJ017_05820 [Oscillospiraceae bacterium]|nr:hypothetical protein [Oscillospiraceae bacterium]
MIKDYPLDITRVPFSRRTAGCMIFCEENGAQLDADNGLYLSQNVESVLMGGAQFLRNKNYLLITPVLGAEPVEYTYSATMSKITIKADAGIIEITFDRDRGMRIKADKLGIRLTAKMGFGDVAALNGTAAKIEMDTGVFNIVPKVGTITVDSHYDLLMYRYSDPVIELIPDDGKLEVTVYDRTYDPGMEQTGTFEECVAAMEEDLNAFADILVDVPDGLETLIYGLWIAEKPFRETIDMYPSNVVTAVYPIAKEQPILALPFKCTKKAAELITNFGEYTTKQGLVPEYVKRSMELFQTVGMDYGYAALDLLDKGDVSGEDAAKIYDFLATVNRWWTNNRTNDGGISFFYAYNFECGNLKSSTIKMGTPAITPDLMTRMILLAQALAAYAEKIGAESAAAVWKETADARYRFLMEKLWKDGKFVCMLADGTEYESDSVMCCAPIMLGKTLCADAAKAVADTVVNKFLVPGKGITVEAGEEDIDTVTMSLIISGLADAGFAAEAKAAADAVMEFIAENGLYAEYSAVTAPEKRCAALYQPVACAAVLAAVSKTL